MMDIAYSGASRSDSNSAVLSAHDLCKSYGPRPALRGLSLTLEPGRVLGFLGPNGAGKTTAIRILTTILEPTSGRFSVAGIGSERPEEIRRRIGVLPESLGFPKHMTGIEFLTYFGQLHGRSASDAKANAQALLADVGLGGRGNSPIGSYSRGMRQRLGIARALVNDPVVVFLDEPTLGRDPRGQQELLGLVKRIARERNAGVVLCTHFLSEIEGVCDDVIILNEGGIVATGAVAEVTKLSRRARSKGMRLRVQVAVDRVADAQSVLATMGSVARSVIDSASPGWMTVEMNGAQEDEHGNGGYTNGVLDGLIRAQIPVFGFEAEGGRLRDVFLHLTEQEAS